MTTQWTPEKHAEALALCEAATVAPWLADTKDRVGENWLIGSIIDTGTAEDGDIYSAWIVTTDHVHASEMVSGDAKSDAEFIAGARTLLPEALAEIERRGRDIELLKGMLAHVGYGRGSALPQPVRPID